MVHGAMFEFTVYRLDASLSIGMAHGAMFEFTDYRLDASYP